MDSEVSYLLTEEDQVSKLLNNSANSIFDDSLKEHPLEFLTRSPFSSWWNHMQEGNRIPLAARIKYNITDAEELVFWLMAGDFSYYFRDDKGMGSRKVMIDIWERFLSKAPYCKSSVVRRYLKSHDRKDFEIGEMWECPFSLTCTTNTESDWPLNNNESLYEIQLSNKGNTKAKSVYEVYNHGVECENPEFQVNFPKMTTFRIVDIKEMENGGIKIIMQEI